MQPFWVNSGLALLDIDDHGGLHVSDAFLRAYLLRPELAPIDTSCAAERHLHDALLRAPAQQVSAEQLAAFDDRDAAENYGHFLRYRDRLLSAATYLRIHTDAQASGRVDVPPLFIDQLAQIIMHQALIDETDAVVLRAAELWFREQRVMLDEGRVVVADAQTLDEKLDPGMGELGRMLASGGLAAGERTLDVIGKDNADQYFGRDESFDFALEITHGSAGAVALSRLIERWVANMLGATVKVRTLAEIDDAHWRWHTGLDEGQLLEPSELRRLLVLARLDFDDMRDQRADVAGKPVYLALGMSEAGLSRFKPQNLLLNLPLARRQ
mgnify:FL=1